jgi:hypothetical protein
VHGDASESVLLEQREHQNKQRECQHKIHVEQREHEYQLCHEEMAIAQEDACTQRQLMNAMIMAMLDKNGGDNETQPPTSPIND